MTRVAVIGCGAMGSRHAMAVASHPTLDLEAVVDPDRTRAESVASDHDATAFAEYEDALATVDAAVVASPEPAHESQANAVLDRDLHLLLEKPITEELDAAHDLATRARDCDRVTAVSFVLRYDPAYAHVHRLARSGELGDVVAARAMRGIATSESRHNAARGHPNYYLNVHDIDALATSVGASVEAVSANERRGELADLDVPDAVQATLTFENGATAVLEGYGVLPEDIPGGIVAAFDVTGTDGTASVDTPGDTLEVTTDRFDRPDTRHWPVTNGEMAGAVRRQIDRFGAAIDGEREMKATIADGYRAQRIAKAIKIAAESDEQVSLSDVGEPL